MTNKFYVYNWKNFKQLTKGNELELDEINESLQKDNFQVGLNGKVSDVMISDKSEGKFLILNLKFEHLWATIFDKKIPLQSDLFEIGVRLTTSSNGVLSINEKNIFIEKTKLNVTDELIISLTHHLVLSWIKKNSRKIELFLNTRRNTLVKGMDDLSTYGWDTVYSMSYRNMNQVMSEKKLFPQRIESFKPSNERDMGCFDAVFKNWNLMSGGDGSNLVIRCLFDNSKTNYLGSEIFGGTCYDFSNEGKETWVTIKIKLDALNNNSNLVVNDKTGENNGSQELFSVKLRDNDEDSDVVLSSDYSLPQELDNNVADLALFNGLLKNWFETHIAELKHIFSFFQLEETAKDQQFQWLKPTDIYYGVSESEDGNLDTCTFSVMTMTENRQNNYPTHTVDNRFLDQTKTNAALAINLPIYVQKWLMRGILAMGIAKEEQLEFSEDGMTILNKEPIPVFMLKDSVPGWEDITLTVEKGNLSFGIANNKIVFEALDVHGERDGKRLGFDYSQAYTLQLKSGMDSQNKKYTNVLIPQVEEPVFSVIVSDADLEKPEKSIAAAVFSALGFVILGAGLTVGITYLLEKFGPEMLKVSKLFKKNGNGRSSINSNDVELHSLMGEFVEQIPVDKLNELKAASKYYTTMVDDIMVTTAGGIRVINPQQLNALGGFDLMLKRMIANLSAFSTTSVYSDNTAEPIKQNIINFLDEKYSEIPSFTIFGSNLDSPINCWPNETEFLLESTSLVGDTYLMGGHIE